jgi:RNA polymerase sigma-70 factor (TIGR02960 family)
MLRVWRSLGTYEQRAPLLHWLYRIATTMSLKIIENRAKQPGADAEIDYLEPYPDALLDVLPADTDPAAAAERRESVSPAFIAALQLLPATQRAALILCEVLTWRAAEVANLLDTTVPAVTSALQRARASLRLRAQGSRAGLDIEDRRVLTRFADAWHRRDIAGLAELLREDVELRMPPESMEFHGRDAVTGFFATVPGGGRLETSRLIPTRSNGQQALAAFEATEDEDWLPHGLMVFDFEGEAITRITGFPSRTLAQVTHGAPEVAFTGLSPVAGLS